MSKWLRRIVIVLMISGLVITNVLTLTSTAFNAALTGLVATFIGVKTATGMLHRQIASQKAINAGLQSKADLQKTHVRNIGRSMAKRTKRIAAYSISEVPASIIPYAGLAILVAGTAWELKLLCEGLYEMEELYTQMEIDEPMDPTALQTVCHPASWAFPINKPLTTIISD